MTLLTVKLSGIQHVKSLRYSFDLDKDGLVAIVGKNGAGKSTLAKALRTLSHADTFEKTAARNIFTPESRIDYQLGDDNLAFTFDASLRSLNCKDRISQNWRTVATCELSVPYGERFNFFKSISDADLQIRRAIILGDYSIPTELILFLKSIYADSKFDQLVEVRVGKSSYYCIRRPDDRYVREDYFSSGEYFLVSLYRRLRSNFKLVFIDEIDISLDASAQVRLVHELRKMCHKYGATVGFTTHSLAMMKTLHPEELHYMEEDNGRTTIKSASYNFIKSLLYGFKGWDKYILTEDEILKELLEYVIQRYCKDIFYQYIIIYIGGNKCLRHAET